MGKRAVTLLIAVGVFMLLPRPVQAMHIMEGFLPLRWAIFWTLICLPFLILGVLSISRRVKGDPQLKLLLGVAGAFAFILSALKLPSVTGSSSHPTGVGLGAILFGPAAMSVIGCMVLLFQALLLAHGGLTTLGANTFSMAVAGPGVAALVYRGSRRVGLPVSAAVFLAACLGDLSSYTVTAVQLGLAFPSPQGGVAFSITKFLGIFAITQIPLAISEGLLTVIVFNFLNTYSKKELKLLKILD